MAFGLIRCRNLKLEKIAGTDKHNARLYDSPEAYPENIDPKREHATQYSSGNSLMEAWEERTKEVTGIRSNSNVAIEYVVGINDKKAFDNYTASGFLSNAMKWVEERHGKGSAISWSIHEDESNPHAHIVVVPLDTKIVKRKNRNGESEKTETRLDTRTHTGGREKLRELQDDYFQFVKGFEARLGVPIYRGTLIEDQNRKYQERTSIEISDLKVLFNSKTNELDKARVLVQIKEKEAEIAQKQLEEKEIEVKKREDRNKWQNKGVRDNPEIFHKDPVKKVDPPKPKKDQGRSM